MPIWAAIGIAGVLRHRMGGMAFWQLSLAIILTTLVADVTLKPLFHTARPWETANPSAVIGPLASGFSFPSGHAANAFAAAVALARGWPAGTIVWFALAALVSYSRLYLGVHFPIDVAGGILVGLGCGFLATGRSRWTDPRPTSQSPSCPP